MDRYVLKEVFSPFFLGLLVYTFVLEMNQFLVMSELFIEREIPLRVILALLVYLIPAVLAFTTPMSVLLGILAGLSRMSSDVEITALKTLGVSYKRMARPLLVFALCGWALTSYLSFYLAPHANHKYIQTIFKSVVNKAQVRINPREFNEAIPNTMLYIQDVTQDNEWKNIFVYFSEQRNEPQVVYAKTGRLNLYPEQKRAFLELFDGVRHSYPLADPESIYRVFTFERLEKNIDVGSLIPSFEERKSVREKDINELFADIKVFREELSQYSPEDQESVEYRQKNRAFLLHRVEAHKKFSIPFACIIFALLGLPLGAYTKKGGRTSGFTISIGIIIIYYVLITAGEQMAKEGRISAGIGMWGANILLSLAAVFFFLMTVKETFAFPSVGRLFSRKGKTAVHPQVKPVRRKRSRVPLRFPNILDRYIIKKFLVIFTLIFISFIFVFIIITFFERIADVYEHNKPFSLFLTYIWYMIPEFVHYCLPVSSMTAALLTLGLLTKTNEITAMKASGMSVYRIIVPVVFLAFLVSVASFYLQEYIYPYSNKKAEEMINEIRDIPPRSTGYVDQRWVMGKERNRFYYYRHFDPFIDMFSDLSIYEFEPETWSMKRRYFAEKGIFQAGELLLINCWHMDFQDNKPTSFEKKETLELPDAEEKSYFIKEFKEADQLNYGELADYIAEIEEKGFETVRYKVDLHFKLTYPLAGLVMALLGIPFAFSMGKRGTLVGMGLSLFIAVVYWGAIFVFRDLGHINFLSPLLAAWGPTLIFGLVGLYLLFTIRT